MGQHFQIFLLRPLLWFVSGGASLNITYVVNGSEWRLPLWMHPWETLLFPFPPCIRLRAESLCSLVSAWKMSSAVSTLRQFFFLRSVSFILPSIHFCNCNFLDSEGLSSNYTTKCKLWNYTAEEAGDQLGVFSYFLHLQQDCVTRKVWKKIEECLKKEWWHHKTLLKKKNTLLDTHSKSMHIFSWFHVYRSGLKGPYHRHS